MIEAYKKFWKGYVDFEGRSTRSDYWFAYLANMLTVIAFYVLLAIFGGIAGATESSFFAVISFIILFIFFAFGVAAMIYARSSRRSLLDNSTSGVRFRPFCRNRLWRNSLVVLFLLSMRSGY